MAACTGSGVRCGGIGCSDGGSACALSRYESVSSLSALAWPSCDVIATAVSNGLRWRTPTRPPSTEASAGDRSSSSSWPCCSCCEAAVMVAASWSVCSGSDASAAPTKSPVAGAAPPETVTRVAVTGSVGVLTNTSTMPMMAASTSSSGMARAADQPRGATIG